MKYFTAKSKLLKENAYLYDLCERIENAKKNNMPEESKLFLWGEINTACVLGAITQNESREVEDFLEIDKDKYWKAYEIACFGYETDAINENDVY
jgi:hypothetical protein